jgi:DNA helicase-2/ATP-dependent DNA helicase PcrA
LRRFINLPDVKNLPLSSSGRSALPIIELANYLAHWSRTAHPVLPADMTLTPPDIQPTGPGDPQPNPEPGDPDVVVYDKALSPKEELDIVVRSLLKWLPQHPDKTVAVLAPDNERGFKLTEELKKAQIPFDDTLLRSDAATREAAKSLATILLYISRPQEPTHLASLWTEVWWPRRGNQPTLFGDNAAEDETTAPRQKLPEPVELFARALTKARQPENFIFPTAGEDWIDQLSWLDEYEGFRELAERFRSDLRRWTEAVILPVDELVLTLGNDLFTEPADLALTHSIAVLLAKRSQDDLSLRLPQLAKEVQDIAQNKRRVLGFSEDSMGFEPPTGKVTVSTMHSAKGLEWDRVYLMSVSDYSFPSGRDDANYRGQRWYVRDDVNLVAEAIEQVRQLRMGTLDDYEMGEASRQARLEIAAERLRLLYVGITRARQELIITYNTGRRAEQPNQPALPFRALLEYWSNRKQATLEAES